MMILPSAFYNLILIFRFVKQTLNVPISGVVPEAWAGAGWEPELRVGAPVAQPRLRPRHAGPPGPGGTGQSTETAGLVQNIIGYRQSLVLRQLHVGGNWYGHRQFKEDDICFLHCPKVKRNWLMPKVRDTWSSLLRAPSFSMKRLFFLYFFTVCTYVFRVVKHNLFIQLYDVYRIYIWIFTPGSGVRFSPQYIVCINTRLSSISNTFEVTTTGDETVTTGCGG